MAEIKLTRVDFRLIHGQIVVKWCKAFEVDKIVVIDNVVAGDEFMLRVYASAVPAGIAVKAYDEAKALRLWNKNRFGEGKKVLILFKDLETCHRMIQAGMDLKSVQLGGVPPNAGQKGGETGDFPGAKGDAAAEGAARQGCGNHGPARPRGQQIRLRRYRKGVRER